MRELKMMTALVYLGVAGVVVSFGGGIFTAVRQHQEDSKPHPSVFPTPATLSGSGAGSGAAATPAQRSDGGLPTPAQ